MSNGILPLDDKTLSLLKQNQSTSSELNEEVWLKEERPSLHPVVFEDIEESMVKKAALKINVGSGSLGLDTGGWRRIAATN